MPEGAGCEAYSFEAKLGDVLVKFKDGDMIKLEYTSGSKPVDFETWVKKVRMQLESRHSQIVSWWDVAYCNALATYERYLALSPLQRSAVRPEMRNYTVVHHQVERYMRCHLINAVPMNVQSTLLHMSNVTCVDVLYQVLIDAGPGTENDRANALKSVVQLGP